MVELAGSGASLADFIWKNAEDLWGDFKHTDFGKIILPFTLLRRLECVLEPTREGVRESHAAFKDAGIDIDLVLRQATRYPFYNTSEYALGNLGSTKTRQNLQDYIAHFSDNARIIFEQFDFTNTVIRLDKAGVLFKICKNFAGIDLHPEAVPDRVMSNLYEHLIRRFGAEVNEGAEDFMTPRDVVHLATALLLDPDDALFESNPGLIRTLYDPTCGTGGFLTDAMNHVAEYGNRFKVPPVLVPHGQELEPETHAVCLTSMLLRTLESDPGRDLSKNIRLGSTLSNDQFANERFHYCLSNPPFGKKWEKDSDAVNTEHKEKKYDGRFGPGLPRINDGSMLFLMHLAASWNCLRTAVAVPPSSYQGRRCSTAGLAQGNLRFVVGCWKTIWLRPSWRCLRKFSSAPVSAPISGFCPTRRMDAEKSAFNSSMPLASGRRSRTKATSAGSLMTSSAARSSTSMPPPRTVMSRG